MELLKVDRSNLSRSLSVVGVVITIVDGIIIVFSLPLILVVEQVKPG